MLSRQAIYSAIAVVLLAATVALTYTIPYNSLQISLFAAAVIRVRSILDSTLPSKQALNSFCDKMPPKTPVYFVSHGGPFTMFDTQHPVHAQFQALGREITQKVKPKAIVVFSAHWQSAHPGTSGVQVNVAENEPLLYDYSGFPKHYYTQKFPNKGSSKLASRVMELLGDAGIRSEGVKRGLDHGVFVPFKIMFDPETNPITVPIVQVSLFDNENDAAAHLALGRSLQKLRDEGVLIIVSGMAVHNTGDFRMQRARGQMRTMEYVPIFDEALREAVKAKSGSERDELMKDILKRSDARSAHPTFEHLLPIHVGVGAAGDDEGKRLWTMNESGLSWAQYRFGIVAV